MKKYFLLFVSLYFTFVLYSQKILTVNFDHIKELTQDSLSEYYYPNLTKRFFKFDENLSDKDYFYLYYGSVFIDTYNPYGLSAKDKEFLDLYKEKEYDKAIEKGKIALNENPANLPILFKIYASYYYNQEKEMAELYANHYLSFLKVIYHSGDGKSIETAYVVISVKDEYEILADLNLNKTRQALLGNFTDVLYIQTKGQKKQKGKKKIKELYFNVEMPFRNLMNQVKKNEE